jgi:23S rRNA (cytosine1962-C5)-methyltransferase
MTDTSQTDAMAVKSIKLLAGKHKRAKLGHPWIFSNEIEMTPSVKSVPPGSAVRFVDASGSSLGAGFFNPHSLIAGRLVNRDGAPIDRAMIETLLGRALALRERLFAAPYYRLVHAEADGLPGLIIDRYGDYLVVEANSAGIERMLDEVIGTAQSLLAPKGILLKGDSTARRQEGLKADSHWVGDRPREPLRIVEGGVTFLADPDGGQKTGWFFDQTANRALVARHATGSTVLDLYCYLGGFALQAAATGAKSVTAIDRSQPALDLAAQSATINGLADRCTFRRAKAFDEMEQLARDGKCFDIVVADPPAFVKSRKDLKAGARGYRKMVRLAAPLVAPGGLLFAASCSHHVDAALFADQVRRGLSDAGRSARILHGGGAGPDHPVHPHLPESAYLKFELLQLD